MSNYKAVSSRTGMVHIASARSYNAVSCNSSNRGFHVSGAMSRSEVERATTFCGKCFPNGKPDSAFLDRLFAE